MSYGVFNDKKEFRVPDGKGGAKRIFIRKDVLQRVQSRVRTHEGEILNDRQGRKYMDEHSKRYLGKDLSGMYRKDV